MLEPGSIINSYLVEERIGEGGMAAVFRVRHTGIDRRFAMKLLTITSPEICRRLER